MDIQQILQSVSGSHRGTGGAIAVLQNGEVIGKRVWGYADIDRRIKMTAETVMPICSITKQMLCAVRISLEQESVSKDTAGEKSFGEKLSERLEQTLSIVGIKNSGLTISHLSNNQSGIRDYWAMTVLFGAHPEGRFSIYDHGPKALKCTQSLHFKPGTQFSYCNMNFYIIASLIENVTGHSLADLLAERLFVPAGMATARLSADTANLQSPCVGYEGSEQSGFIPARNRIEWGGDAGIAASLADMIAYEQHIDKCHSDPNSWYSIATTQPSFPDGTPAVYANGLGHGTIGGISYVGHGGALRGYRLFRLYAPEKRASVVVMFNHETDPIGAAEFILRKAFGQPEPQHPAIDPAKGWTGAFLDPELQLAITVKSGGTGHLLITCAGYPEKVRLVSADRAESRSMTASISEQAGGVLSIHRIRDHRHIEARRIDSGSKKFADLSLIGDYHCAEANSVFHCEGQDGILYGSFDGFLGQGPVHLMRYLGDNVWLLICQRAMDVPAPGDWTMVFDADEGGNITGFTIGCWIARGLKYTKSK